MRHLIALLIAFGFAAPALAEGPYRYAWVPVDAFDRNGKPVNDEKGRPIHDGFCILWKTNWDRQNVHLPINEGALWWTGISYYVDPQKNVVLVYRVWGPDAVSTDKGPKFFSREEVEYDVRKTAPLFNDPKDDWPCTKDTWASIKSSAEEWVSRPIMPPSTYWIQRSCSPHC